MYAAAFSEVAIGIGKHEQFAAARGDFLHVGFHFFQQRVVGCDDDHRHFAIDQCQRAVLELAGRVGFGMNIGDFLQFQCAFQRDRVMHAAAEEQRMLLVGEGLGPFADLRLEVEGKLHTAGKVAQGVKVGAFLLRREQAALFGKRDRQRKQRNELSGEGLGRSNADFGTGTGVKN